MSEDCIAKFLENLSDKVADQNLTDFVSFYDGNSENFENWIKEINKFAIVNNLSDERKKLFAYKTSNGFASDFISNLLEINPTASWENFENLLRSRFAQPSDFFTKFIDLRRFSQAEHESVHNYAERLFALAKTVYNKRELDLGIIQKQLTGIFTDGLKNQEIKTLLIRQNPQILKEATKLATDEINLKLRTQLRLGKSNFRPATLENKKNTYIGNKPRKGVVCHVCYKRGHISADCFKRKRSDAQNKENSRPRRNMTCQSGSRRKLRPATKCHSGSRPNLERALHVPEVNKQHVTGSRIVCYFCREIGHVMKQCPQHLSLLGHTHRRNLNKASGKVQVLNRMGSRV